MLFRYLNSIFSMFLLLITLFWQFGCSEQQETPPNSGNMNSIPNLVFSSLEHNFGEIWDVETKSCSFPFTNTGTGILVFEKIQPGCGCTTTTLSKQHTLLVSQGLLTQCSNQTQAANLQNSYRSE